MKLLLLSTDKKILEPGSSVRERMMFLSQAVNEMHIVVRTRSADNVALIQTIGTTTLYATNSWNRLSSLVDMYRLGFMIAANKRQGLIVSAQDPFELGLIGWLIARAVQCPLQVQIHTDFLDPHFRQHSFMNRLRVWLSRVVIPRSACMRVVSQRIAESVRRVFNRESFVLPVFIDVAQFKSIAGEEKASRYPDFDKIILMASRLTKEKNIAMAVKAFAATDWGKAKVGLIIVGEGSELPVLRGLVERFKIGSSVIFEPWAKNMTDYYRQADLFVSTSDYEGYGLTLLEASASGLPIISTDVGIAREVGAQIISSAGELSEVFNYWLKYGLNSPVNITFPDRDDYLRQFRASLNKCVL